MPDDQLPKATISEETREEATDLQTQGTGQSGNPGGGERADENGTTATLLDGVTASTNGKGSVSNGGTDEASAVGISTDATAQPGTTPTKQSLTQTNGSVSSSVSSDTTTTSSSTAPTMVDGVQLNTSGFEGIGGIGNNNYQSRTSSINTATGEAQGGVDQSQNIQGGNPLLITRRKTQNFPFQKVSNFFKRFRPIHYLIGATVGLAALAATITTNPVVSPAPVSVATPSAQLQIYPAHCYATRIDSTDSQAYLPDPTCTPGAVDPGVTQANIQQTICVAGYTKTIRSQKPVSYFESLKQDGMKNYGFTDAIQNHEEDHLISLELGGSNSPYNLWPEPHASPNEKDKVENYLHAQVCAGQITLQEAQKEISTNWYQVFLSMHEE